MFYFAGINILFSRKERWFNEEATKTGGKLVASVKNTAVNRWNHIKEKQSSLWMTAFWSGDSIMQDRETIN